MPYDRNNYASGPNALGWDGATISLAGGNYTVPDTVKSIVVVAAGNIVLRPKRAGADITITSAPVGFVIPWHCQTIVGVGTTATLATVIGQD
jgi:hypothetical protein